MLRTQIAKKFKFDDKLPDLEDWDFLLRVSSLGIPGKYMKNNYCFYRIMAQSRNSKQKNLLHRIKTKRNIQLKNHINLNFKENIFSYVGPCLHYLISPIINYQQGRNLKDLDKEQLPKSIKKYINEL